MLLPSQLRTKWASLRSHFLPLKNIQWRWSGVMSTAIFLLQHLRHIITIRSTNSHNVSRLQPRNNPMLPPTSAEKQSNKQVVSFHHFWINQPTRGFFQAFFVTAQVALLGSLSKHDVDGSETSRFCNHFPIIQSHFAWKMCSNYPGIKLVPGLGT